MNIYVCHPEYWFNVQHSLVISYHQLFCVCFVRTLFMCHPAC